FLFGAHDRFFGEDRMARLEGGEQMLIVQMVGRADHDEIERSIGEKRLDTGIGFALSNVALGEDGETDWPRIDIARHVELPADFLHRAQDMRDALAQPDDADAMGFHEPRHIFKLRKGASLVPISLSSSSGTVPANFKCLAPRSMPATGATTTTRETGTPAGSCACIGQPPAVREIGHTTAVG